MPLIIKGKIIDKTSPKICVPIVERSYEDIIAMATRLTVKKVEMVEWRADFFEDLFDKDELKKLLGALKSMFKDTVFLVTVRSVAEGGQVSMDEEEMKELLMDIAGSRCPDLMDMEYFTYQNPGEVIKGIQSKGIGVIASHHDFSKTPKKSVCLRLLEEMASADPDLVKLCTMPGNQGDVFELGSASHEFFSKNPYCNLIIISMGNPGVITRICPGAFNSSVTFGSVYKGSAPGQVEYDKLKELIDFTGGFF